MREITIDGRRIADDEKAYIAPAVDGLYSAMQGREGMTIRNRELGAALYQMQARIERLESLLLESNPSSTNENRNDDDA